MDVGALKQLRWLVECGVDEAVEATPRDRFTAPAPDKADLPDSLAPPATVATSISAAGPTPRVTIEPTSALIEEARSIAGAADSVEALAANVAAFDGCALKRTAKHTVFADDNPEADLMFIGEAPGAEEDRRGLPFVGAAGRLLDLMLQAIGRDRTTAYITNILFWRPPGNRNPSPDEAANCREFLDAQLATVDPDYIVCLGTVAAQNLLDSAISIGKMRGKFYRYKRAQVLCTYHPSYLLRNPAAKKEVWNDMKFLMRDMGVELD